MHAFAWLDKDLKFLMYLGSSAQMIQLDQKRAVYIGGLGVNYKRQVVIFEELYKDPHDFKSPHITAKPLIATKTKMELQLNPGRLGHSAFYDDEANSIFVFGGQQEGIGGPKAAREFQNDLWRLCLKTG